MAKLWFLCFLLAVAMSAETYVRYTDSCGNYCICDKESYECSFCTAMYCRIKRDVPVTEDVVFYNA